MDSSAFFQMVTKGGAVGSMNHNNPPPPPPATQQQQQHPHNAFAPAHGFEYSFHNPGAAAVSAQKLAPVTTQSALNNPTTLYSPIPLQQQQQVQATNAPAVQQQPQANYAPTPQPVQFVYVQQGAGAQPTTASAPAPQTYYAMPTGGAHPHYQLAAAPAPQQMHVILPAAASSVANPNPIHSAVAIHPGIHDTCGPVLLNGRLRHGRNVHTVLAGVCRYVSYNDPIPTSSIMIQGNQGPNSSSNTPLPLFVQMFPSEHKEQFQLLFERILQLVCGPAIATVHAAEPRSDTSFLVFLTTSCVWHVIHFLRCRVLMDRHGFWYAEDFAQFEALMQYCDRVRSLPPPQRNAATDGLPSRALVVELSRTAATVQGAPPAPAPFDAQLQMRARE